MRIRLLLGAAALVLLARPVFAQDAFVGLAPADEYFGHFNLSVLGISNAIHDAGAHLDAGADARPILDGPLAFATDAIHAWEAKYPADPWIAKDLLALESVYLKVPTDDGLQLAGRVEAWLLADYPRSEYAARGRAQLAGNVSARPAAAQPDVSPWERFAALRSLPAVSR